MSDRTVTAMLTIPSDLSEARRVQEQIENALQSNQYGDSDIFAIKLAVEEALVNAIKHGNQMDPEKEVRISYSVSPEIFEIKISDDGPGFKPDDIPDPTTDDNIERPCGRGLFIIRNFMTVVEYQHPGNIVFMSKLRSTDEDAE